LGATAGTSSISMGAFQSVQGPLPHDPAFRPFVRDLARKFDIVYPTTEPVITALHDVDTFPWMDEAQATTVLDKRAALQFARRVGLSTPAGGSGQFPVVVKAITGRGGDSVSIVRDDDAMRYAVGRIEAAGRIAHVERYIPGPTFLIGGLFERGRALRLYAGRKLRQHPARTGPASLIRSERPQELVAAGLRFFEELRWTGLASADFVQSSDGRFHFLEVNARPWGSIGAARACRVDLFTPLAALMRGEPVDANLDYDVGVTYRIFPLYLLERRYQLDPLTLLRVARSLNAERFWLHSRLAYHLVQRLLRVQANWPDIVTRR
jgi:hypothetical protein